MKYLRLQVPVDVTVQEPGTYDFRIIIAIRLESVTARGRGEGGE